MGWYYRIGSLLLGLLLLAGGDAGAQQPRARTAAASDAGDTRSRVLRVLRVDVEEAPVIDGRLDDAVWGRAEVATGFTQLEPDPGEPATQRTEARVLYTDEAVYVGMRLYDTAPDSIVAQLARRDESSYSDWAHVAFDSYNDQRTAFRFSVNPRGAIQDAFHYDDTNEDDSWDAVWDAATTVDADGWTAEFRIPLSQLRFSTEGGEELVWGVNFAREIARRSETSFWSPVLPDVPGIISRSGRLEGIRGLEAPRNLEVMPYSVGRLTRAPDDDANPFYQSNDVFGSVGADLKYGVTSNLTLTATINPDFGQVEADPSVVNLSAYETFYPEKRPFFVEGADIFRFGIGIGDGDMGNEQLFYSRRIGRTPQGEVPGDYADAPDATTILGAAKLSGKTKNGWSIGFLDALTAPEEARYVDDAGQEHSTLVEPMTNYAVARVIKDFRQGRSAVGGIVTATHRRLDGELEFLRSAAYTGGIDARHRFGNDNYLLRGFLVGSHIRGDTAAIARVQRGAGHYFQRPDADHVDYDPTRTSLSGVAGQLMLAKIGGGHWRWGAIAHMGTPGFEVNDLGYQRETDFLFGAVYAGYQEFHPGSVFRNWRVNTNAFTGWTFGGEQVALGGNVNGSFQLVNYWGGYGGVNYEPANYSTDALRGGPMIIQPGRLNSWFGLYTDARKPVRVGLHGNARVEQGTDGGSFQFGPSLTLRPSTRIELSLNPSIAWNTDPWQYVTTEDAIDTHYVFGRLEQKTVSLTTRLSYTFSPTLSVQFYAQPFVSAGDYSAFKEVADPRADAFDDRFHTYTDGELTAAGDEYHVDTDGDGTADFGFDNPDFNFKQFRSNLVLRWEYRPGSTLYAVWTQGRTGEDADGSFGFGRDFGRLFGLRTDDPVEPTNVLLLKVNYWLGL